MKDEEKAAAIETDYTKARLSKRERAMLDYSVKLAQVPPNIRQEDLDLLRKAGFSDSEILDVCQIAAYYTYVNRMALGLGVELEDYWEENS
ncbi:MAG: peroxidase [Gemmatimonadetes bacterium]|nr:peroxidase [Gemmatimonadota bacterium]